MKITPSFREPSSNLQIMPVSHFKHRHILLWVECWNAVLNNRKSRSASNKKRTPNSTTTSVNKHLPRLPPKPIPLPLPPPQHPLHPYNAFTTTMIGAAAHTNHARMNMPGSVKSDKPQRRRRSVLDSTRNLMATLKQETERRKTFKGTRNFDIHDPIEQFLRKVDMTQVVSRNSQGIELDTEDDWLPTACRCFMKPVKKMILIPDAPGRLLWDVLVGMMIVYYLIMVPLRLAFDETNPGVAFIQTTGAFLGVEIIFDLLFIGDLVVNFRTAYNDAGELVTDPSLIAFQYLRGWFWLDLLSSLPTTLIQLSNTNNDAGFDPRYNQILRSLKWIKLLKLMRVLRLKRITERFEHIALFWNAGTLRVMRCFITAMVVWHLVACMYFVTAHGVGFCKWADANANTTTYDKYSLWDQDGSGTQPNGFQDCYDDWTPWNQIVNQPFATQYAQAFFWAIMVTTGVGKDINPQSDTEVIFTCICIMIGVFLFSIIIGSLSSAIQSMDHKSNVHNQQLERINHFMSFNKVPHYMQVAIHQFYEYKWGRPETDPPFSDLPNILKIRLKVLLNREALLDVPVFKELPPDCMIALTQHVKSHTLFPTEFSTHQGQQNSTLYIIRHGRMQLTRHPLELSTVGSSKKKWKTLLRRWQANEKKRRNSLANTALTAFRDAFILTTNKRKDTQVVTELARGNFYGANCLMEAPEDFSCSAIVFSEVLLLDMTSSAMKLIIQEYPVMKKKLKEFAETRRAKIQKQIISTQGISRSKSLFGGSGHNIHNIGKGRKGTSMYSVTSNEDETLAELEKGSGGGGGGGGGSDDSDDGGDDEGKEGKEEKGEKGEQAGKKEDDSGGNPLKAFAKAAVKDEKQRRNTRIGMNAVGDPALHKRIRDLEETVNDIRRVQDAQYQTTMEKLEELLANIYV